MLNARIRDEEIVESIKSLKNDKSPGPDGLCAEIYKYILDYTLPYLKSLFNEIFENSNVPEVWCYSIVSPIHKKDSKSNPNN